MQQYCSHSLLHMLSGHFVSLCVSLCHFVSLCVTFSTDHHTKMQARITLNVGFTPACICFLLFHVMCKYNDEYDHDWRYFFFLPIQNVDSKKNRKKSIKQHQHRRGSRITIEPSRTLRVYSSHTTKHQLALLDDQLSHLYNDEDLHNSLALYYLRCITDLVSRWVCMIPVGVLWGCILCVMSSTDNHTRKYGETF